MARTLKIDAIKPRVQYRADGVRREFVFPFPVFTAANLEVYLDDERVADGLTFSGIGETAGGAVAFANPPVGGATVTIRRRLLLQRRTDFQESGPFRASALNDELDYLTAAVQQLETEADRSMRLRPSDGDASMVLPPASERAGRALVFDQNGDIATSPLGAAPGGSPAWRTLDDVPEGQTCKYFGLEEKAKLQQVEDGAQVNPRPISAAEKAAASETASRTFSPRDVGDMVAMHAPAEPVASVHGRTGAIVAQAGDYSADDIADTAAKVLMTAAERTKLTGIAAGAQVNPIRVTAAEKSAGTSTILRGYAPVDVREMVVGAAPVASVLGRTGVVVAQAGDYTADQIGDTAAKVLMTAAERNKLAGVAAGAQAHPAMVTAAEKTSPQVTVSRSFAPKDIADMIAGLVVNIDGGNAGSVFALTMP